MGKIKLTIALIVLFIIGLLVCLFLFERGQNRSLRKEGAHLQEKLRQAELRRRINESSVIEIKTLKPKGGAQTCSKFGEEQHPSGQGSITLSQGNSAPKPKTRNQKLETSPDPCQLCFQNYQYQVEVKDEEGNWIFQDDNLFDDKPGTLTLTDKFWSNLEKTSGEKINTLNSREASMPTSARLKNRLLLSAELNRYKIEYAYSPLGMRTNNLELGLTLYSSLSMRYPYFPLEARAGIGMEIRF